jgi:hypothetical protein
LISATLLLAAVLASPAIELPAIDLGDPLPANIVSTDSLVMVSPAQLWPEHTWVHEGVQYSVAVDRRGRLQYIATTSPNVATAEGVRVGQPLKDVVTESETKVVLWPGWGYVIELSSGWKAGLFLDGEFLDREPRESDTVDLLFKGTMAGYGH